MKKTVLILSIIIIIASVGCVSRTSNPPVSGSSQTPFASAGAGSNVCTNPAPLEHVYHPYRLAVIDSCKTVSGTVTKIIKEKDGDTHIRLNVDPQYADTINQANIDGQDGYLVLEIVCAYPVTQKDAVSACADYENEIAVPAVNEHITVTGQFVSDTDHGGWNEIHPVYQIIES